MATWERGKPPHWAGFARLPAAPKRQALAGRTGWRVRADTPAASTRGRDARAAMSGQKTTQRREASGREEGLLFRGGRAPELRCPPEEQELFHEAKKSEKNL